MREAEGVGNSIEEAIADGCARLGLDRSQVEWEILETGSRGLLGILGARRFRVRVRERLEESPGIDETADAASERAASRTGESRASKEDVVREFLGAVGRSLGFAGGVKVAGDAESIHVDLSWGDGDEQGLLIGRGGEVLDALQYLSNVVAAHASDDKRRVILDVGGYRGRHTARLERMARRAADIVRETGESVMLPAMPAGDRRVVHMVLGEAEEIVTVSRGEEPARRVVVALRGREEEPAIPWEDLEQPRVRGGAGRTGSTRAGYQDYDMRRGRRSAAAGASALIGSGTGSAGSRKVLDRRQEWPVGGPWRKGRPGRGRTARGGMGGTSDHGGQLGGDGAED